MQQSIPLTKSTVPSDYRYRYNRYIIDVESQERNIIEQLEARDKKKEKRCKCTDYLQPWD